MIETQLKTLFQPILNGLGFSNYGDVRVLCIIHCFYSAAFHSFFNRVRRAPTGYGEIGTTPGYQRRFCLPGKSI